MGCFRHRYELLLVFRSHKESVVSHNTFRSTLFDWRDLGRCCYEDRFCIGELWHRLNLCENPAQAAVPTAHSFLVPYARLLPGSIACRFSGQHMGLRAFVTYLHSSQNTSLLSRYMRCVATFQANSSFTKVCGVLTNQCLAS